MQNVSELGQNCMIAKGACVGQGSKRIELLDQKEKVGLQRQDDETVDIYQSTTISFFSFFSL